MKFAQKLTKYWQPVVIFVLFEAVAVTLWLTQDNIFYLINFTYIGIAVSVGMGMYAAGVKRARMMVQLAVGLYMFGFLGIIARENMQIEGFWYYLFSGVFQAAVIHYAVAKIGGPLVFGRGWCGYACWTAMVLDFLPYKAPQSPRRKKLGGLRYVLFALSPLYVLALFRLFPQNMGNAMYISFLTGNAAYYIAGVALAFAFRDNRAFCKYLCPITVFLKPMSYFSLMRIKADPALCVSCGKCKNVCPMDVDMLDNRRSRKNGTECIQCMECVRACPKKALK